MLGKIVRNITDKKFLLYQKLVLLWCKTLLLRFFLFGNLLHSEIIVISKASENDLCVLKHINRGFITEVFKALKYTLTSNSFKT